MRVSDNTIYGNMKRNLGVRRDALAAAQERALTGMKVTKPSDDTMAFTQARSHTVEQKRAASYERTVTSALPSLETSDTALGDIDNVMRRVRDIAIQGANDTLNPGDREGLRSELDGLKQQLVTLGNTKTGDRYIFGGYRDGAPPFDDAGVYTGATAGPSVEAARNVMLPTGITGDRIFGNANGGQDMFQAITDLQTALTAGTTVDPITGEPVSPAVAISAAIAPLDVSLEQVRVARSEIGLHLNAADISIGMAQREQDQAGAARTKLIEIDTVDAYSDLVRAQTALSAAVEIAAQLPPPGLVDRAR
jgi:flagellar hook-associated protein 3 FlgL